MLDWRTRAGRKLWTHSPLMRSRGGGRRAAVVAALAIGIAPRRRRPNTSGLKVKRLCGWEAGARLPISRLNLIMDLRD
jgi:hypothetical protein